MATLMQASHQWATRPADERYTSLTAMFDHFTNQRAQSREIGVSTRRITAQPLADNKGLEIVGPKDIGYAPTHWAFGQLAALSEGPAGYLRTLPSPIAADCINYGLRFKRNIEDVGLLLYKNGDSVLRAATGPNYGRVWNEQIISTLVNQFGDGVTGDWRVPGEFGKRVEVTKENTTLYASDRDFFVFLADETNRIEIPNRRDGKPGQLARGFFCWNSEVGSKKLGVASFYFDYVCCNRIVWGAEGFTEISLRHSSGAPDRWLEEVRPALISYANSSTKNVVEGIAKAQAARLAPEAVEDFLASRFGKRMAQPLMMIHTTEENRPIENLYDVTNAVTAYARSIEHQDERIALERQAGEIMKLAA